MKVHFIAIGGSAMHNLAIALHKKGYTVSGSDDQIYDPAKSRLSNYGLLPSQTGWHPEKITTDLDAVILGMHARKDNPEMKKAMEIGLKIYSYPEFIYEHSLDKIRIVIAGSHGKTSITSMIMHVLDYYNNAFDYLVGAQLEGFENMVKLTEDAPYIILEGDEYLSSPLDPRPKFHVYQPQIALISGIAWDHINVFPTFESYVEQFSTFVEKLPDGACIIYYNHDKTLSDLAQKAGNNINKGAYAALPYHIENGQFIIDHNDKQYAVEIFGKHNMENMNGARLICNYLDISDEDFFKAMKSFKGASKRLELLGKNTVSAVFKDFAHAPSKLKATTSAVKELYPERTLTACIELHTFSSLNRNFLKEYKNSMNNADEPIVYLDPETFKRKGLQPFSENEVKQAFNNQRLKVYFDTEDLTGYLRTENWKNKNLLMMSSGTFNGLNFKELTNFVLK